MGDFLLPKEIKDPAISKPADWVDEKKIADPTDVKPEGWDDIPAQIPDPEAEKPEDWDDEEDGECEHPMIPNPDYAEDPDLYVRCKDCSSVGFELWQVKSGTIFDNIIVSDSWEEAKKFGEDTTMKTKEGEKAMYDEAEEAKRAAAQAAAAEA